jgi:peptide/nickel transport system substrate-binding protein
MNCRAIFKSPAGLILIFKYLLQKENLPKGDLIIMNKTHLVILSVCIFGVFSLWMILSFENTVPSLQSRSPVTKETADQPRMPGESVKSGSDKTLKIIFWSPPQMLNPYLTGVVRDDHISRICYEPLASFDTDGNLIPILAAEIPSYENRGLAKDGKSVTWTLKPGLKWSDGEPCTAEDVVFTFQFVSNPEVGSPHQSLYAGIAAVEAVDTETVQVVFTAPNPAWAIPFVGPKGVILPRHKFKDYNGSNAGDAPANNEPAGTGPYRSLSPGIESREMVFYGTKIVQTNRIRFEQNPFFRESDKLFFRQIEIQGGIRAEEAAHAVLNDGTADYAWNLPLSLANTIGKTGKIIMNFGMKVEQMDLNRTDPNRETEAGETSSLQFPHPFLSDLKVRRAIAYATDRDAISSLYGTAGRPAYHLWVTPSRYKSDKIFYEFNLKKAAALLDEAGWKDQDGDGVREKEGMTLRIRLKTIADPIREHIQQILKNGLESVGFQVQPELEDISIFYGSDPSHTGHAVRFQADIQLYDWNSFNPDPAYYFQYWTCPQIPHKHNNWAGLNVRRFCDPEFDALYRQSMTILDPKARQQIFILMNDMLVEDAVNIPLVWVADISAVSTRLEGYAPTPWDSVFWNIKDWRKQK